MPSLSDDPRPFDFKEWATSNSYVLDVEIDSERYLEKSEAIVLPIATYKSRPYLMSAEILNSDGLCVALARNFYQKDNAKVVLKRSECQSQGNWTKNLKIVLKSKQDARFALWGRFAIAEKPIENSLLISQTDSEATIFYVQAEYAEPQHGESVRRFDLLNFLWGWETNCSLGLAFILVSLFSLIVLVVSKPLFSSEGIWNSVLAFLIFVYFGSIYAFVVPPLQAPDEPDHLLSYMHVTGSAQLEQGFLGFAQRNHFERIKFQAQERFTPNDMQSPNALPFAGHISDSDIANRSPILTLVWKTISPALQGLPTGTHIFALRVLNVLMSALLFACGLFVFSISHPEGSKSDFNQQSFVWLFSYCLHPIIFFFAMHVSNYSLTVGMALLGAALLQASSMLIQKRPILYSLILGACLMGMFLSSSSGISFFGFWFPFLLFFPAQLEKKIYQDRKIYVAPMFLFVGLYLIFVISNSAIFNVLNADTLKDPNFWLQNKLGIILTATICLPLAMYAQMVLKRLWSRPSFQLLAKTAHMICGGIFGLVLILPFFMNPYFLPNIEISGLSIDALQYGLKVLLVMLSNMGLGAVDFYLSSSFWGGIGWLESNFDNWFVIIARLLVGVGVLIQLVLTHKSSNLRLILFNIATSLGLVSMLFGAAFITSKTPINLHGRYLIPYYLLLIAFSACGYLQLVKKTSQRQMILTYVLLLVMTSSFHIYGISHILSRYFG